MSENQSNRRSFLASVLSSAAGVWAVATGGAMLFSRRASAETLDQCQGDCEGTELKGGAVKYGGPPKPGPAKKYGGPPVMKYGGPPVAKYGGPPVAKYGGPPTTKYGGPPVMKYGGPPTTKYGGPPKPKKP